MGHFVSFFIVCKQMAGTGLEQRTSILPKPKVPGILGPDYSYAEAVKLPGQVGVYDGNSIDSVVDSVKAASYYIDTIGFGEPSSSLSADRGVKPLGVNSWLRTGFTCSNGADMWMYMEGIPTGNVFGSRIKDGLASARLPQLRGLAPGIIEDVQDALDPRPLMGAVFGSGFPQCHLEKKRVGDQDGNIFKLDSSGNKIYYMENPETVKKEADGYYYQSRWTKKADLTQEQYNSTPKRYCPNGTLIAANGGKCPTTEGFASEQNRKMKQAVLLGVAAAGILCLMYCVRQRSKN